jgi:diguanylate cyclase (GGDEF)-like protein
MKHYSGIDPPIASMKQGLAQRNVLAKKQTGPEHKRLDESAIADLYVERAAYKHAWERCCGDLSTARAGLLRLQEANAQLKQQLAESAFKEKALQRLAYHDTLTGVPNRLLLREYLSHEIIQARRRQTRVATLFLDLDHFKNINDSFGHATGDEVLKQVATRLTACLRAGDIVSRYAGDEFVLVLIDIGTLAGATQIASKVIEKVAAPYSIDGHELQVTISIGIAIYPENGRDFDSLIQKADAAMLSAKANGRNDYEYVDDLEPVESESLMEGEIFFHHNVSLASAGD